MSWLRSKSSIRCASILQTDTVRNLHAIIETAGCNSALLQSGHTAEIRTKPTGLKYDPEDPVRWLGQIGKTLLAAGFGSIIELQRNIDPAELRKAIERIPSE